MKRINLDKDWMFYESEEGNSFVFEQRQGTPVDLPHDFIVGKPRRADAPGGAANGYFGNGQGIYKKNLEVPEDWKGKTVLIYLSDGIEETGRGSGCDGRYLRYSYY